jgi:hypothetical protein
VFALGFVFLLVSASMIGIAALAVSSSGNTGTLDVMSNIKAGVIISANGTQVAHGTTPINFTLPVGTYRITWATVVSYASPCPIVEAAPVLSGKITIIDGIYVYQGTGECGTTGLGADTLTVNTVGSFQGTPISGAQVVIIANTTIGTVAAILNTNSNGSATFTGLSSANYLVLVTAPPCSLQGFTCLYIPTFERVNLQGTGTVVKVTVTQIVIPIFSIYSGFVGTLGFWGLIALAIILGAIGLFMMAWSMMEPRRTGASRGVMLG